MHVVNDQYESSFGILTDKLKTYENLGLACTGRIASCKKKSNFASGFRKLCKDSKFIVLIFTALTFY